REMQLSIGATNARHVAINDRSESILGLDLELSCLSPVIGDKVSSEHAFVAERILMAPSNGEQVNQGIEIPKPILYRCRREHEDEFEGAFSQNLAETDSDLRRGRNTIQIPELMRFIED